jgi:hypothetical protein
MNQSLPKLPKGHLSCLSASFRYTPSSGTNIAKTFARIKRTLRPSEDAPARNVRVLPQKHAVSGAKGPGR